MLYTLFDSGATFSCINAGYLDGLEKPVKLFKPKEVETANKGHYVRITSAVRLDFYVNDVMLSDEFMVVPNLSKEAILGVATLQKWRIKLDFEHDEVIIDPKTAKFILKDLR